MKVETQFGEVTHCEFLWNKNFNTPVNVGTQGEAGQTLRYNLVRWVRWGDSLRIYGEHKFKCASECWDAGWVDLLPALSDIMQSVVLPQISHWSHQLPALPGQKKWWRVIIYVQEHTIRGKFWTDFHEIRMLDAGPPIGEPYCFCKQSAQ